MEKFWIVNKVNSSTAEIFLYGYIDQGVSSGDFIKELRQLEKEYTNINVRINSGGGSVFEGLAIYNAMQQSRSNIETYIDALAASMASIIALGGKKCHMSKSARIMTHQPSVGGYGNSDEHKKNAMLLDGLEKTMLAIYSGKTGKKEDDCKACFLNGKDNWFNATDALKEGLVDSIYDGQAVAVPAEKKDAKSVWDLYSQQEFAAVFNNSNSNMKQYNLSAATLAAMKLTEASDGAAIDSAIGDLVARANKADDFKTKLEVAEAKIIKLEGAGAEKDVTDQLDKALNADKKITKELHAIYAVQYKGKPAELKAVLDATPAIVSVTNHLKKVPGALSEEILKMTWSQLDEAGKLEEVKAKDINVFFDKFEQKFNKKHPEDKRD